MSLKVNSTVRGLAGGVILGGLAAATFAWGTHLGPENRAGRDLYQDQAPALHAGGMKRSFGVVLTSSHSGPLRLADSRANPNGTADETSAPEDFTGTSPSATFQQVYYLLKRNYADGVPDDKLLAHGAVSAMIGSLQDPYSRFLEPAQMAEIKREQDGQYAGIGAALAVRTQIKPKAADDPTRDKDHPDSVSYQLTVLSALPGSPAEKAGLKTGDVITDIDGHWIQTYDLVSAQYKELKALQDKNDTPALNKAVEAIQKKLDTALQLSEAQAKLSDPAAKSMTLTVARPGQATPLSLTLDTSSPITVPAVSARSLSGGMGLLKVNLFNSQTASALDSALASLGSDPKGVVVDLRGASGSNLDAAAQLAAHLTTASTLGYRQTKGARVSPIPLTPAKAVNCPVVVLVGAGTQGVAEMAASALQAGGAKLIGAQTFGDDTDVRLVTLRDGSGFTMTVGKLRLASGAPFGGVGVKPDVTVPQGATGADEPLNRAVVELSGRVARAR